jgi:hypothetical protein
MEYNVHSRHGMEQRILAYYAECLKAEEEAEKAADKIPHKTSVNAYDIYQWCTAQVMALEELMHELDIDYEEDDEE